MQILLGGYFPNKLRKKSSDMADSQALHAIISSHSRTFSKKRREHNILIIKKGGKTNGGINKYIPCPATFSAELSPWGHTYFGYYDQKKVVPPKILPKLRTIMLSEFAANGNTRR